MKNFLNKKIIPVWLTSFLFTFFPSLLFAACEGGINKDGKLEYCPLEGKAFEGMSTGNALATDQLGTFLAQAFSFGLAIAAALAVIMIVWGGVEIMTTDSWSGKSNGKQKIWDAIWGLGLALVSWLILYTINPDILNFRL